MTIKLSLIKSFRGLCTSKLCKRTTKMNIIDVLECFFDICQHAVFGYARNSLSYVRWWRKYYREDSSEREWKTQKINLC